MNAAGHVLGGAALVGVGVGIGAWATQHAWPRTLSYLLRVEIRLGAAEFLGRVLARRLAGAEKDLEELRADIPKVWDRAFKAGRHSDEWTLVAAEVQRREREHGGGQS